MFTGAQCTFSLTHRLLCPAFLFPAVHILRNSNSHQMYDNMCIHTIKRGEITRKTVSFPPIGTTESGSSIVEAIETGPEEGRAEEAAASRPARQLSSPSLSPCLSLFLLGMSEGMEGAEPSVWEALEPSSSGLPDSEPAGRCGHGELQPW